MSVSSAVILGTLLGMQPSPVVVRLQLSDDLLEFRVVVSAHDPVTFDAGQLLPPARGLPPARVGAIGLRGDGVVVACGAEGRPAFPYAMVSGTNAAPGGNDELLQPGVPFVTDWYGTKLLLKILDRCAGTHGSRDYERFKIIVELDTGAGPLKFETDWTPLPDAGLTEQAR